MGGFGSAVLEALSEAGITHVTTKVLGLPDWYIEQGPQDLLRERYGLTAEGIYESVKELVRRKQPDGQLERRRYPGQSGSTGTEQGSRVAIRRRAEAVNVLCIITRRKTRQIRVGKVKIGGDAPVSVQSMCSTDTRDVAATVAQIRQLGRSRLRDDPCRRAGRWKRPRPCPRSKRQMTVPLIADIHFDHRLAFKAAEVVDCVRINPGNIGRMVEGAGSHQGGQ